MDQPVPTLKPRPRSQRTAPPVHPLSDQYGSLVRKLTRRTTGTQSLSVVGVTSTRRREGVSTTATNLAIAAAECGLGEILLVDANWNAPSLQHLVDGWQLAGLAEVLEGEADPFAVTRETSVPHLSVLLAGIAGSRRGIMFAPEALEPMLSRLKPLFDLIVFDLPPAGTSSLAAEFAAQLDGVLFVVESEGVRRQSARHVTQQLAESGCHLLGVVLNKRRQHLPSWLDRLL